MMGRVAIVTGGGSVGEGVGNGRAASMLLAREGASVLVVDLDKAAADVEPLIAEHARWAIEEIRARRK